MEKDKNLLAITKYARISFLKTKKLLSKIVGKSYENALRDFQYAQGKAAFLVWNTLYAAVSNACKLLKLKKKMFIISEAYVNKGPFLKRQKIRARGKTYQIQKKMSHITIKVKKISDR